MATFPPPGIVSETVGVALVTVSTILTGVNPFEPKASVTVTCCVYVPTGSSRGAVSLKAPVGFVLKVVIERLVVCESGVGVR